MLMLGPGDKISDSDQGCGLEGQRLESQETRLEREIKIGNVREN